MMYVTGLDRGTAERHFRWRRCGDSRRADRAARCIRRPGGTDRRAPRRPPHHRDQRRRPPRHRAVERSRVRRAAHRVGDRASRLWRHPARLAHRAVVRSRADRAPTADPARAWPRGDAVEPPAPPSAELAAALDALFANSPGIYGILIASPDRVLAERYSAFGAPDRATPSWSMTKAITCTLIGRLIHEGWLGSVYDPAPAPLWRDPRSIHHLITLDHLLRMRSGLGFPVRRRARPRDDRLREQRGLSGRRRCVRRGAALDRRDRAGIGVPLHQRRHQRARRDHPRSDRKPRPAVPCDAVRTARRPARHGQLSAFG